MTIRRKPLRQRTAIATRDGTAWSRADRPSGESETSAARRAARAKHENRSLDDLPVPATLVSRDGRALACNQAWAELVRSTPGATAEQTWLDAIHPSSRGHALAAVAEATDQSDVVTGEWRLADDDENVVRTADARIMRGEDGNVRVALWETTSSHERGAVPRRRATHDPLTGLLNRDALADVTRHVLERLERPRTQLALLLVDLDDFTTVNERFGWLVGDRVLVAAAAALAGAVRPTDTIARIGSDAFGVLCEVTNDGEVATIAQLLRTAVSTPINFGDVAVEVAATVVIARAGDGCDSFESLLERADQALHFSKRTRRISSGGSTKSTEAPATTGVRVMIVDDRRLVAEALMLSLQQHGFAQVALAKNVTFDRVVSAAKDFAPDVALVDSELTGSATSMSLIRTLDEMGIVVVMLTGNDEPERSAMCLEAGAVGIFDRSKALEDLMDLLTDAAMGRTVLQPASRDALLEVVRSHRQEAERRLAPFRLLTSREQAVLAALMQGKSAEVIAKEHHVSLATVRTQIRAVLQKLGVNSQLAAVALAIQSSWAPTS